MPKVTDEHCCNVFMRRFARSSPERRAAMLEAMKAVHQAMSEGPAELPLFDGQEGGEPADST